MNIKYFHIVRHLDMCKTIIKTMKKLFSIMLNLQTHYHFKLDFQKVVQRARGEWLILGTKHHKVISGEAWNSAVEYLSREIKHDIKEYMHITFIITLVWTRTFFTEHVTIKSRSTFNSLVPGEYEWNFKYVIFKGILVTDGWGISCEIALIWMSLNLTDDQSVLVQVMAWCHQICVTIWRP